MPVSNVAANAPATSSWANDVADLVNDIEADLYVAGALAIPWASITGEPTEFTPADHAATHATGGGDAITPASIGAPRFRASGALAAGGTVWVGTADPVVAHAADVVEGDVWVKG